MNLREYAQRLLVSLVCLMIWLLPALAAPQGASKGQAAGQVSAVVPTATRNAKVAKVKEELQWQDFLKTDTTGRLRANLRDGSILTVGRESQMTVTEHDAPAQRTSLELKYGRMRSQVVQLTKPGSKFEVRTPHAIIGVIGTDFYVLVTADMTLVICFSGKLLITPLGATAQPQAPPGAVPPGTTIESGQMVEVRGGAVGKPQPTPSKAEQEAIAETTIPEVPVRRATGECNQRVEVAGGYTFSKHDTGGGTHFNASGARGSVTYKFNQLIGVTADFGLNTLTDRSDATVRTFTYMFGPRFSFCRARVTPFFHTLVGGNRMTATNLSTSSSLSPVENVFSMAAGGGFDINLSRGFAVRPVQVEYYMTRFLESCSTSTSGDCPATQSNVRFSTGIVLRF